MARNNNKINLPTNTTDIRTMANYLIYIDEIGLVSKDKEQDVFAKVKINESKKNVTSPAKDTHTKSTLKLFGLIDVFDDDSFSVSPLGKEVLNFYSNEDDFSEEDRIAIMLKVLCKWEIKDSYGRHMHPGHILIKLLHDSEMDYYITNHELAHFSMSQNLLKDAQYNEIKAFILDFRSRKLPYDKNLISSKSDIFLATFVNNWKILTKSSKKVAVTDEEYKNLLSQWKEDPVENDGKTLIINELTIKEFRLTGHAAYISHIYLSLLEGKELRDYLSYFDSSSKKISSFQDEQKIYFGAPGTGKSYKVDQIVNTIDNKYWERITFHPEFDYASFVGGYKPSSEKIKNALGEEKVEIQYKFVPQAFANIYVRAWGNILDNKQYYLVIEEINRGNCAEIFGDIFQLLDRKSDYTVSPSKELNDYLIDELGKEHEGVKNGLRLPSNLSILATMNTSDQSLFPMDSAFKRRWDWEYIPINYEEIYIDEKGSETKNNSYDYVLIDSDKKEIFGWIDFIKTVNNIIKNNANLGMDKCIGNFFVQPADDKNITLEMFVNKVIFYLWIDVFKDEEDSENIFPQGKFYEDFFPIQQNGFNMINETVQQINVIAKTEGFEEIKFK